MSPQLSLVFGLFLTGCITTGGLPEPKIDLDKARQTHVQLGLRYLQSGDNRETARRHFFEALKLGPKDPRAHHGLAMLYQVDGEMAEAESHFKKALRYDSNFSMARTNYGVFLYRQQRYKEALKQFKHSAADLQYPRRSYALANSGRAALKLGQREAAEQAFTRALALNRNLTLALLELAELKFNAGEYSQAKYYLERFSAKNRQIPQSLWLGIRIEKIFGNRDKEKSHALALKNLFPYSEQALKYKKMMAENDE
ncbi:MAG: type IV pilus biogenesis/stability protein PilW [Gammaproteobacteria bacterium]|nr:type IV pilus biogenesis/stability protein PilW [Gammaproteobacteria bacterium]